MLLTFITLDPRRSQMMNSGRTLPTRISCVSNDLTFPASGRSNPGFVSVCVEMAKKLIGRLKHWPRPPVWATLGPARDLCRRKGRLQFDLASESRNTNPGREGSSDTGATLDRAGSVSDGGARCGD